MTKGRNPAIVAGLLSGLVLVEKPTPAYAITSQPIRQTPLGAIFMGIGAGLAVIAVISGVYYIICHLTKKDAIQASDGVQNDEPQKYENDVRGVINSDSDSSKLMLDQSIVIPLDSARPSIAAYKPKHMRASQWDMTGSIRVQSADAMKLLNRTPRFSRSKTTSVNITENGMLPVRSQKKPAHSANDYVQIAENYTKLLSFREKTIARAKGAAAVLRERLGADPMEGLPIIERADGTVGDVGTAWWTKAVGEEAITKDFGIAEIGAEAIPEDFTSHAADISSRISYVDQGVFPEKRTIEELQLTDSWELALAAMDERLARQPQQNIPQYQPVQVPVIGKDFTPQHSVSESISAHEILAPAIAVTSVSSETNNLDTAEGVTSDTTGSINLISREPDYSCVVAQSTVMPVVSHTENVSSHVQSIFNSVEKEMAAEIKAADERPTRELLRLIEGGTSRLKKISSIDMSEDASSGSHTYTPRHFSSDLPIAQEA